MAHGEGGQIVEAVAIRGGLDNSKGMTETVDLARLRALREARLGERETSSPGYTHRWCELEGRLLDQGGALGLPPAGGEEWLDELLARGVAFEQAGEVLEGEPSQSQRNVAGLWRSGVSDAIVTGYALGEDGVWRQHCWGQRVDGRVIETTNEKRAYFGVRLTERDADRFAFAWEAS